MTVDGPAVLESFDVEIPYVKRNSDGELPNHAQMFSWEPEFMDMQPGKVRNVRSTDQSLKFSIASSGFEYARLEDPELPDMKDWTDPEEVKEKYFPKLEALLKERCVPACIFLSRKPDWRGFFANLGGKSPGYLCRLGASEVRAFHHIVRNTNYEEGMGYTRKHRCPARRPHVDVTSKFAPILLSWDCPDMHKEVHDKDGKHWQMINAWKPLKTIRKNPVMVAHTASMDWKDYLVVPQPEVSHWRTMCCSREAGEKKLLTRSLVVFA